VLLIITARSLIDIFFSHFILSQCLHRAFIDFAVSILVCANQGCANGL